MDPASCVQEAQETSAGVRKAATSAEVETPKHLRRELDELAQSLPQTACLSVVGSTAQVMRFDSCGGSTNGLQGALLLLCNIVQHARCVGANAAVYSNVFSCSTTSQHFSPRHSLYEQNRLAADYD